MLKILISCLVLYSFTLPLKYPYLEINTNRIGEPVSILYDWKIINKVFEDIKNYQIIISNYEANEIIQSNIIITNISISKVDLKISKIEKRKSFLQGTGIGFLVGILSAIVVKIVVN